MCVWCLCVFWCRLIFVLQTKSVESYFSRAAVRRTSFSCLFEFIFSAKYLHRPLLHSARLAQKRVDAIANDFLVIHFIIPLSPSLSARP